MTHQFLVTLYPSGELKLKLKMYAFCRHAAALILIVYGAAKLMGAQFIIESYLDTPMGQVPDFWLTWHYFGHLPLVGAAVWAVQIAAGLLLLFRRTAFLGALAGVAILSGILLLNIDTPVDPGAILAAVVGTASCGYIIWTHRDVLQSAWRQVGTTAQQSKGRWVREGIVAGAILLAALGLQYYIANYNNRAPTAIDGTWEVVAGEFPVAEGETANRIYFERNRAYMMVARSDDNRGEYHFEVDEDRGDIQVWDTWLTQDNTVFTGSFENTGDGLHIDAAYADGSELQLELERVPYEELTRPELAPR